MGQLIRNALKDYQALFEQKQVGVETSLGPDPVFLHADPLRMYQVIGNLLHNAVKFTPKGGHVRILLEADAEAQQAILLLEDDGEGVSPELMPKLFHPFIQVDQTLDRSRGGLGLGLSIVKGMVDLHGGNIQATSPGPGKGTSFTLRLPLMPGHAPGPEAPIKAGTGPHPALRILVIEDNEELAESTCMLLRHLGHDAAAAYTGRDGIAKAREGKPDAIFSDIGLPDITGYQVAMEIRELPGHRHTPLFAITGYGQPEDRERSKAAGFARHLAKPMGMDTLKATLEEFFG